MGKVTECSGPSVPRPRGSSSSKPSCSPDAHGMSYFVCNELVFHQRPCQSVSCFGLPVETSDLHDMAFRVQHRVESLGALLPAPGNWDRLLGLPPFHPPPGQHGGGCCISARHVAYSGQIRASTNVDHRSILRLWICTLAIRRLLLYDSNHGSVFPRLCFSIPRTCIACNVFAHLNTYSVQGHV